MSRTAEMVLGIIGGIFGLVGSLFAFELGGIAGAVGANEASNLLAGGAAMATIASIVGIVGASIVRSKTKLAGWLMLGAAIAGIIGIFMAFMIPGILLGIAGIMALIKKE